MALKGELRGGWQVDDVRWGAVWVGYFVGLIITAVVGVPLLLVLESSWLLALAGLGGLLFGGFVVGRKVGPRLAPINGALTGIVYYFTVALAFFAASFLELLPEPLPGLPQGDSTFFFAWPLAQLVVSVLSAALGSRTSLNGSKRGA